MLNLFDRRPLSRRIEPSAGRMEAQRVVGMITDDERRALAAYAEQIWRNGARREGLVIDAGPFAGSSTIALAEGLSHSPLSEAERRERIWSYDLFLTTPGMSGHFGDSPAAGESFRPVYERNIEPFRDYVRVIEGDIRKVEQPGRPVSILFVDILWSWEATQVVSRKFYPLMERGRSLLIHQDFVYPYYPWIIIGMGLLARELPYAINVPYSSAVFDVARPVRAEAIDDGRNVPIPTALSIYDAFIDRLEGSGRGLLALGKALFLASHRKTDEARALIEEIGKRYADDPVVLQHVQPVLNYCRNTDETGVAHPLDEVGH